MHSVAIIGFFSLVLVFFFIGRDDFGLKPTPKKVNLKESDAFEDEKKLEEIKN